MNRYNSASDGSSLDSVTYNSGQRNVQVLITKDVEGTSNLATTYTETTDA